MEFEHGKSEMFCDKDKAKLWPLTSMWTDKDVHDFVCDIGFGKYAMCFRNNAINGQKLLGITPYDLQRIGVKHLHDALQIHAAIQASTSRMWYNHEDHSIPPNISYPSTTKGLIAPDPKLAPSLQPTFDPRMPPLPGNPYEIDYRDHCLPYRYHHDNEHIRSAGHPALYDHCITIGRTDKWKMYNSDF